MRVATRLYKTVNATHCSIRQLGCRMNMRSDHSMKADDVLRVELEVFKREHRDLDEAISAMQEKGTSDALTIQRMKKRKLLLKDKIAVIEDRLTTDIIA